MYKSGCFDFDMILIVNGTIVYEMYVPIETSGTI